MSGGDGQWVRTWWVERMSKKEKIREFTDMEKGVIIAGRNGWVERPIFNKITWAN